jgi:4-amino-4-deoxy-L-arabinose transferase-like glycosyltransferase
VETKQPGHPPSSNPPLLTRIGWAVLIVATLYVCYFSHLGAIGFVGPDEPRYAWIARDIAETGDWVTPHLYGQPWFEKPPLFYWGAALSFKLFGVSEAAARLPSAVSALLATLTLAWLAWRLYDAETARWLLLLLPTTVGMIGFSHAAATDMPFSATLTIAMVAAAVVVRLDQEANGSVAGGAAAGEANPWRAKAWLALVFFGFFLGLAVLAKGPAGIILCGGSVFFWALFTKRWRDAFRLLHPVAVAAFCLTALPWYILCARRNPDFFRVFIIEHNFERYLTPEFQHMQPFWYYLPILLLATLPWTALLAPSLWSTGRVWSTGRWRSSRSLLFTCWILFTLVFFSLSRSKLPGYVLPVLPPLCLFGALNTSSVIRHQAPLARWLGVATGLTAAAMAIIPAALFKKENLPIPQGMDVGFRGPLLGVVAILLLGGILAFTFGLDRRLSKCLHTTVLTFLMAVFIVQTPLPQRDLGGVPGAEFSARYYAQAPRGVSRESWNEGLTTYKLNRSYLYGLDFYLHKELPEWQPQEGREVWVVTDFKNAEELMRTGLGCGIPTGRKPPVVICKTRRLSEQPAP